MIAPLLDPWLAKVLGQMVHRITRRTGTIGDPRRFDGDFSLNVQAASVGRAEAKRERKARLRRLNRA